MAVFTYATIRISGRKALWVVRLKDEILALGVITLIMVGAEVGVGGCVVGTLAVGLVCVVVVSESPSHLHQLQLTCCCPASLFSGLMHLPVMTKQSSNGGDSPALIPSYHC